MGDSAQVPSVLCGSTRSTGPCAGATGGVASGLSCGHPTRVSKTCSECIRPNHPPHPSIGLTSGSPEKQRSKRQGQHALPVPGSA